MNNQTLIITCIILCSLSGWYLVVSKYFALKAKLKKNETEVDQTKVQPSPTPKAAALKHAAPPKVSLSIPAGDFDSDQHIPGMGPPPLSNMPFQIPSEVLASLKRNMHSPAGSETSETAEPQAMHTNANTNSTPAKANNDSHKRYICNWASILHLSGLAFVTGIPFLNIIVPTILWLLKKEQHPYLARQGREVINFQITLSLLQFLCLGLGAAFIWIAPNMATSLITWTRTLRVVFATGMYIPFNLFTALPFFWACIMVLRGSVAAYNGLSFKYPLAQQFLFSGASSPLAPQHTQRVAERKEPQLRNEPAHAPPPPKSTSTGNKITFG